MHRLHYIIAIIIAVLIAFGAAFLLPIFGKSNFIENAMRSKLKKESFTHDEIQFELVDPGEAPQSIRALVEQGYQIMLNTPANIENYSGAAMSCTNCHFAGGNTTGGKNNGISLVGVSAVYPRYNPAVGDVETLPERINNCFERSLNGKAIPVDSKEMKALLTYFQWISRDIRIYNHVSWLGLPILESTHIPNAENGKIVFETYCAMCHGKDGNGESNNNIPPLWGPRSFNAYAGMNNQRILSSFIYYNMPYDDAGLTQEQAIDAAAFIAKQPREK